MGRKMILINERPWGVLQKYRICLAWQFQLGPGLGQITVYNSLTT